MQYTSVVAFALKAARSAYVTESYKSKPVTAIKAAKEGKSLPRKTVAVAKGE
jgi:hypothetical protein